MGRPCYDDAFKANAIALAVEFGPADAARAVGVNAGTIRSWCSRAGVATVAAERMQEAVAAHKLSMEERRARLSDQLFELAEMSTEEARERIGAASLRDLIGALDYAIKNAQLLSGQATTRSEHLEPAQAAEQILDELEQRRAEAA